VVGVGHALPVAATGNTGCDADNALALGAVVATMHGIRSKARSDDKNDSSCLSAAQKQSIFIHVKLQASVPLTSTGICVLPNTPEANMTKSMFLSASGIASAFCNNNRQSVTYNESLRACCERESVCVCVCVCVCVKRIPRSHHDQPTCTSPRIGGSATIIDHGIRVITPVAVKIYSTRTRARQ
jgi:hypothetical protein